jgi:hypothetical protein
VTRRPKISSLVACAILSACGASDQTAPDTTPAVVEVSSASIALVAGETTQLTAVVKNAANQPLAGAPVAYSSDNTTISTVSADGLATAVGPLGIANITVSSGAAKSATVAIVVSAGPASNLAKAIDLPAAPAIGSTNAVSVMATDAFGNAAGGVAVIFAVTSGGGSLAPAQGTTDAKGFLASVFTLGSTAGTNSATATAAGLTGSPLTFSATTVVAAAKLTWDEGSWDTATWQ